MQISNQASVFNQLESSFPMLSHRSAWIANENTENGIVLDTKAVRLSEPEKLHLRGPN